MLEFSLFPPKLSWTIRNSASHRMRYRILLGIHCTTSQHCLQSPSAMVGAEAMYVSSLCLFIWLVKMAQRGRYPSWETTIGVASYRYLLLFTLANCILKVQPLFPSLIRIGFGLLELRQGLGLWWFSSLQYTRVVRIWALGTRPEMKVENGRGKGWIICSLAFNFCQGRHHALQKETEYFRTA